MFGSLYEQDVVAIVLLGIVANFAFSIAFGLYMSKNIGLEQMMLSKGNKQNSWVVSISLLLPYIKMFITLYRVIILQVYFLNTGRTHQEYWEYLTKESR